MNNESAKAGAACLALHQINKSNESDKSQLKQVMCKRVAPPVVGSYGLGVLRCGMTAAAAQEGERVELNGRMLMIFNLTAEC
ncbi:MAG: hypothetical protein LBH84_02160 [Prevotellaceae bacterium]|jgi:hypothetical protein|nr:hypothetical protein [Prevotellaceae bacterium]